MALLASFSTQSNVKLCCVVEAKTHCRGLAEHMGTRSDGDTSFVKKVATLNSVFFGENDWDKVCIVVVLFLFYDIENWSQVLSIKNSHS